MKTLVYLFAILILSGCVTTDLVPKGYEGPTAMIRDSAVANTDSQVDFFYVNRIGGRKISESRGTTRNVNYGRGFVMDPVVVDRRVTGTLSEDYSAVWIEDAETHEIVGEKIEIQGSAALGFFQK